MKLTAIWRTGDSQFHVGTMELVPRPPWGSFWLFTTICGMHETQPGRRDRSKPGAWQGNLIDDRHPLPATPCPHCASAARFALGLLNQEAPDADV